MEIGTKARQDKNPAALYKTAQDRWLTQEPTRSSVLAMAQCIAGQVDAANNHR